MPARSSSLAPASSEPLSRVSVCRRAGGSSHKHGGSSPWTGRLLFSPLGQQQEAALACLAAEQGEVREARLPSRSPVQAQIRRRFSPQKSPFFGLPVHVLPCAGSGSGARMRLLHTNAIDFKGRFRKYTGRLRSGWSGRFSRIRCQEEQP